MTPSRPARVFGHIMAALVATVVVILGIGIVAILLISFVWLFNMIWGFANG